MKLSESTVTVLKNFAKINPAIKFKEGQVIRTLAPSQTVMAKASLEDNIDGNGAVSDLNRFLSVVSLHKEPSIEFGEKMFKISSEDGKQTTNYTYGAENLMVVAPDDDLNIAETDIVASIYVEWKDLETIIGAANTLQVPHIVFTTEKGQINIVALNKADPDSDQYSFKTGKKAGFNNIYINVDTLKLLPYDYQIDLTEIGMIVFKGVKEKKNNAEEQEYPIVYWIAAEAE